MIDNIENNDITQADNRLFRIYNQIIKEARTRDFEVKGEKHHIFPKCIFGQNDIVVKLTHEEHFKVHYILWKAYKFKYGEKNWKTIKLANAFKRMSSFTKNMERYIPQNTKEYLRLKEANVESMKGIPKSEEHKKNMSIGGKKRFEDPNEREKIRIGNKNKIVAEETKQKLRKPRAEETKQKLRKPKTKKFKDIYSIEERRQLFGRKGTKNGMCGKYFYRMWIEEFGQEIADKMFLEANKKKGINVSKATKGIPKSEEFKRNMCKKVYQYDLNMNFIREYCSVKEAFEHTHIRNISAVCRGELKQARGFIWKYESEVNNG